MLTVLLATSAYGAVTGVPTSSAQSSGLANAGVEASSSTQPDKLADNSPAPAFVSGTPAGGTGNGSPASPAIV
ncbi:hypothetical protein [Pseudarthrobacter raffinosi]|uniref:hypothetical protein n=1 Tax=Pseudarthrobacter raffinosi TaxID=2953651 RepID=UPI00208F9CB0|nr:MULTISPECIES: hypothetical protein [unclassified Pseudarthrobacter]MCO4236578.1 hypothetical protein [Pseudarthrobacter sp. MDT3-28]MCO4250045.1 hypothetical protein [Pseudarthrobacter sp. MDT3-9]MCO4262501.1 hypothetical protein [Pseudarthrobacter sp. MDT3-26]